MKNRDGSEPCDDWQTPGYIYEPLDKEFHFNFDPCPFKADFDGLAIPWKSSNFVNPPYNRLDKPRFIQKAYEEWLKGNTSVLLIPAATGTKQFHDLILPHAEIRWVRGRIAFIGVNTRGEFTTKAKGKHDSMIVIFRGTLHR
jgi:site-specific DNA-methyltransferase (adenine-specific)